MSYVSSKVAPGTATIAAQECRTIASLFTVGMAVIACVLSFGTDGQPLLEIYFTTGVTLLLINSLTSLLSKACVDSLRMDLLWTMFILLAIFFVFLPVPSLLPHILSFLGFLSAAANALRIFGCDQAVRRYARICAIALLYVFVVGQLVWGEGYRNPLDVLLYVNTGAIHTDPAFHKAVIASLKVHGVCSTGMDGVQPFAYHYATHFFASRLGLLIGASAHVLVSYLLPILLPSLLIYWVLRLVLVGCEHFGGKQPSTIAIISGHFVLLAGFGGYLPPFMLYPFLYWNWSFTMDSQILAMTIVSVSILGLSLVARQGKVLGAISSRAVCTFRPQFLLIAVFTIVVLAATKVTVAHHFTLGIVYFIARSPGNLRAKVVATVFCISAVVISAVPFSVRTSEALYLSPLGLWIERVPLTALALFLPVNAFFCIAYTVMRLNREGTATWGELLHGLRERRFLDVELLLLIAISGVVLTGLFDGKLAFNTIYYLCTGHFVAIIAVGVLDLYPRVTAARPPFCDLPLATTGARLLFAVIFLTAVLNSSEKWRDILRANLKARGDQFAIPLGSPAEQGKVEMRVLLRQGMLSDTVSAIHRNTQYSEDRMEQGDRFMVGVLRNLGNNLTFEEKQASALWVPRTNRAFWDMPREGKRWLLPMFCVGLTELAMIDGCPEEWEPVADGDAFGFSAYPNGPVTRETALSLGEVRARAKQLGFKWVLELLESGEVMKHECT